MRILDPDSDKLVTVTLDPETIISIDPDEVHERRIAVYDLVDENAFAPTNGASGPFALHLSIQGNHLVLDVRNPETNEPIAAHFLSLTPMRHMIRDYFRIRDSYYDAIKSAQPMQIEAVDMGRRGLHNDAAEMLRDRLKGKLEMDLNTARRLFTLICAVQPYADRSISIAQKQPSVLFVCSMNSVRSPMAAALARKYFPSELIARSAGVRSGQVDRFVHDVMEEIGIDMSVHTPHTMDELVATNFDLIVTLSEEAPAAVDAKDYEAGARLHWGVEDPTLEEGNREQRLDAYRALREDLTKRIKAELPAILTAAQPNGSQTH